MSSNRIGEVCHDPLVALAAGFLALADTPPAPNYEQMKAAAGRDAASQVRLALWCEANGLESQKLRHLAVAVLSDPTNAMARDSWASWNTAASGRARRPSRTH